MPRRKIVIARLGPLAAPVGLARVISGKPLFAVIVKLTLDFPAQGEPPVLVPSAAQDALSLARPSRLAGADAQELEYPSDFVPTRPMLDVLLYGHAFDHGNEPPKEITRIDAGFSVGTYSRKFTAVAMGEARRLPLSRAYLRDETGAETGPAGPIRRAKLVEPIVVHGPDFNPNLYNSAAPEQRLPKRLSADAPITLSGLSPDAPRVTLRLPGLSPKVIVDMRDPRFGPIDPVKMRCDTLWIAPEERKVVLVFRGIFEVIDLDEPMIQQIVVALEREGEAQPIEEIRRNLPRAAFFHAVEREHLLEPSPESPTERAALEAAKVRTLLHPVPPDPALPLERYAAIAAELCEHKQKRGEVLARHGLTEFDFSLEQRSWSYRIARTRAAGDRAIATQYTRLFLEHRRLVAEPKIPRLEG